LPSINTSVDVSAREAAQRTNVAPEQQQQVQIRDRGTDVSIDNTASRRAEVSEAPRQQVQNQVAEQLAARDIGSLANTSMSARRENEQTERRPETTAQRRMAEAAGFKQPQQQAPQGRVPVLKMPDQELDVMSSRRQTFGDGSDSSAHEAAEAVSDFIADRIPVPERPSGWDRGRQTSNQDDSFGGKSRRDTRKWSNNDPYVGADASPLSNLTTNEVLLDKPVMPSNQPFGYKKPEARGPKFKQPSNKRPNAVVDAMKRRAKNLFSAMGIGVRIYGKMVGNPDLRLREVGIGLQELSTVVSRDPTMLNNLLLAYDQNAPDVSEMELKDVVRYLREHEVYVATFKPPSNRGQDVQRRRLMPMDSQQRGLYLQPIMAAMYTADFDGDDMEISFDPEVARMARDPMSHMVGIDGKQSLNEDFLPISKLTDNYEDGKTARDFVRETMLSNIKVDGRTLRSLVDAIIELGETATMDGDSQAAAWGKVFREARLVADAMHPGDVAESDRMMETICEDVYNTMHTVAMQNVYTTMGADIVDNMPEPRTYEDSAIYRVLDGMVMGQVPNNFQDLKVMLTGFLGNVEGKNAPFRFTADVGKMMKMDPRLQIGSGSFVVDPDNDEQMEMFFESTVKFAQSMRMARELKRAGKVRYYTDVMRDRVIKDVGFPEGYDTYAQFVDAFCESYRRNAALINQANLIFLTNMGISNDTNGLVRSFGDNPTLSDIAEPLLSIYGTYSIGKMFKGLTTAGVMDDRYDTLWSGNPNRTVRSNNPIEKEYGYDEEKRFWVTGKYMSYNLRQFVHDNRLLRGETVDDDLSMRDVRRTEVSDLDGMSEVDAQFRMLLMLADKRTSTASIFNEKMYGKEKRTNNGEFAIEHEGTVTQMMSDLLQEMWRLQEYGNYDRQQWIDDAVNTLIMSGPDLFNYLNMDSPDGFLSSELAQKMIEHADDAEILGGIRTAMVFSYKMDRVEALMREVADANDDVYRYVDTYNSAELQLDELAASSEVWRGIIRELKAEMTGFDKSVFQMMRESATKRVGQRLVQENVDGTRKYMWDLQYFDAKSFWENMDDDHPTLRSVIEDLDMDRMTKWNIIADVVRYWEQDAYLKSYEVGYQMEVGNDSSYSVETHAPQSALGTYNDFEQAFNRWGKTSQLNLQHEIEEAYTTYGSQQGMLLQTLQRLDSCPWERVSISDMMYTDSILSVMDKVYAQTEKASQHPWTNAMYLALSFQRNGGSGMNDVTRTDDRLLGVQSVASVGIDDVIHVLADPEASIEVYDEDGNFSVVTRDGLLQEALGREFTKESVTEADIWEFLRQNPRIASAIRSHNACVMATTDGDGYLGSMLSMKETIAQSNDGAPNPIDHVKYMMRDHPVYAGIIALANPAKRLVARDSRTRYMQTEAYLANRIYQLASQTDVSETDAAKEILDDMGITIEAISRALRSDYDEYLSNLGLPTSSRRHGFDNGELVNDANNTYNVIASYMSLYVYEVRENVQLGIDVTPLVTADIEDTISNFRGDNYFLSNMYETPVTINGVTYRSAESAFQAQKCADPEERERFAELDGYEARKLGRSVQVRDDWDSVKEDVMRQIIHAKFSNPKLRKMLQDTGTKNLVEGNPWGDRTWGVSGGVGKNLLGNILMDERGVRGNSKPSWLSIDASSIAAFWDVVQELGGAKTNVSTGVEGYETYQFAEWASHITARDKYVDLKAVSETINLNWHGLWTNVTDDDGNFMTIVVNADGTNNVEEIFSRAKDIGIDEVVSSVPDGYVVKDRSTDSYGTQVPSLFAYMVSKRSNGAEAFNLKAKKSGLDGKDSVVKMQGKHRMEEYYDQDSHKTESRRTSFLETRERLRRIYEESGIMAARIELAQMMLKENEDLGYKDLTLSNYMSITELMLVEAEVDGEQTICLRSLEMLFSAIKNKIGARVDEMTDDEIRAAADTIVNDTSGTGVGISQMVSQLDALVGVRPKSKSSSYNGIRQNSSVFERNYDLLSKIEEYAAQYGIMPISREEAAQISKHIVDRKGGVRGVREVYSRMTLVRGYDIVGYAAPSDSDDVAESINWTIGPSNAIIIGSGKISDQRVDEICRKAYKLGMTVIVSNGNIGKIPTGLRKDCIPCSDNGDVIIPCFDMRLNGAEAPGYVGGRFSIFQAPFSRYVVSVEDSTNDYMLGDAQYRPTRALADRIKVVDSGSTQVKAEDLFPNVFRNPDFRHSLTTVSLASGKEVANLIANGVRCTIDYGVVEGGKGFEQRRKDVDAAIKRYQERWSEADDDGIIRGGMTECHPGDIVGWAECVITDQYTNEEQVVLAPIIPFPLHGPTKGLPEKFTVEQLASVDDDNTLFAVDWSNTSSIENSIAKYFDSSGGANKGMVDFGDVIEDAMTLRDGTLVDAYCAKASTDSRKIGTDRRIKTMISLMAMARMHGYNFAKSDGAFPENPELRERLLSERIPAGEWRSILANGQLTFTNDPRVNAFLNYECRKILNDGGNPSDYLANVYTDANGVETNTHVMWEFEAMFDQGLNYEDGLLRFLHTMDPTFCPNGIDDAGDYLFRLKHDGDGLAQGFDTGVLQMQVPHKMPNGQTAYVWDNVYIGMSFFGEDYSGFSRPNADGASNFLDAMNTMAYYGNQLDERNARFRAMWATSDIGRRPRDGGALGKA
jgi:ribA/ribD-fused uncharacterized protein